MTPNTYSWILATLGTLSIYLITHHHKQGFYLAILTETLWIHFALTTNTHGFIPAALTYITIHLKALHHWKHNPPTPKTRHKHPKNNPTTPPQTP